MWVVFVGLLGFGRCAVAFCVLAGHYAPCYVVLLHGECVFEHVFVFELSVQPLEGSWGLPQIFHVAVLAAF